MRGKQKHGAERNGARDADFGGCYVIGAKTLRSERIVTSTYTAQHIKRLEGLEAIRRLPGMYIGNNSAYGLHHLLMEPIDNAVDEIMNGYGDTIRVTLHGDGSASVWDNARGIPRMASRARTPT
jgi:topoisomerase-4 subunit B